MQRAKTGHGCVIDVSMTDWAHAMMVMSQAKHMVGGEEIGAGRDILCGSLPCYDIYATKDGHLAVGALEPKFWAALCKVCVMCQSLGGCVVPC
jgi:alpha-methylacyl-CoA racemase